MEQVIESVPNLLPLEIFKDDFNPENDQIPSLTTYLQFAWLGYICNEKDMVESTK
jgi:hypothetical protein